MKSHTSVSIRFHPDQRQRFIDTQHSGEWDETNLWAASEKNLIAKFLFLFSPSSATILAATHKRSFDSREGPTFAIAWGALPTPPLQKRKNVFHHRKAKEDFPPIDRSAEKLKGIPPIPRANTRKKKNISVTYISHRFVLVDDFDRTVLLLWEGKNRMARMKIFFFYGDITIWMETWVCAVHSDNHFSSFFSKSSSCNGNSLSSRVLSMCSLNCARARSRKEGASTGGSSQRRVTGHIRWWTCHSVLVLQGGAALASLGTSSWKSFFLFLLF